MKIIFKQALNNWLLLAGIIFAVVVVFIVIIFILRRRYKFCRRYRIFGVTGCASMKLREYDGDYEEQEKPEWYEVLQQEIERLPIGKISFNPPATMKVGVKERIETRISRDINTDLVTSLKGRGLPHVEELTVSELMKVRLSGVDFEINTLNEEEQIIANTGFTEWAWDVTPQNSGNKVLHLHVTLRIRLPFGEERKDHPVLDRKIVVQVNPIYSVKIFVATYWKWLITVFILPLIGWIIKKLFVSF